MNLETAYQLSKVPPRDEKVAREAALRERFPVREMIKRGWMKATKAYDDLERSVLAYFHLPRHQRVDPISACGSPQLRGRFVLYSVRLAVPGAPTRDRSSCSKVPEPKLRAALPDIEQLMVEPEEVRHVPRILAEAGVRLVIVEPIPGSKIQGVCFWLDNNRSPVIGLSLKCDQIDKFWFNLWHEIETFFGATVKTTW